MSYVNADSRATGRNESRTQNIELRTTVDTRLLRFLEKLCAGGFFGKVVLSFQNGKIVDVRTEQTKKLDEL